MDQIVSQILLDENANICLDIRLKQLRIYMLAQYGLIQLLGN